MRRRFHTLDVFTQERFGGNPLAVVRDCQGLDTALMQRIAREFNLSETVFMLDARDPVNTARIRIFTPVSELPFAGHPTIGTAVLIGLLQAPKLIVAQDVGIVIEEEIGLVSCTVRQRNGHTRAEFTLARLPEQAGMAGERALIAKALSLEEGDIGFERHEPSVWSAGFAISFVPVASRMAIARARANLAHWDAAFAGAAGAAVFLYTNDVVEEGSHVHARMFAPKLGIAEDPATGAAAAAFAGVCMTCEQPEDGEHFVVIEQGYEMGRPSQIVLKLHVANGALLSASIGGAAVQVSEGTIEA